MAYNKEEVRAKIRQVHESKLPPSAKREIYRALLNDAQTQGVDGFDCLDIVDAYYESVEKEQFLQNCEQNSFLTNKRERRWWEYPLEFLGGFLESVLRALRLN